MRTAEHFLEMKQAHRKIAMLTAYDAPTARALSENDIDLILVGDSVGTNMLGYASEQDVTLADMQHHIAAVRRGATDAYVIGDFPYAAYGTPEIACANGALLAKAGADMVKFEGARPDIVRALKAAGLPVCCHIGLEPQTHVEKRLKGRTAEQGRALIADAKALDAAGMDMIVLELIPEELAQAITAAIRAPTIGIGAGRYTDGQVLVITDVFGFTPKNFKHNKRYADVGKAMAEAAAAYVADVHDGRFPDAANAFHMSEAEAVLFRGG